MAIGLKIRETRRRGPSGVIVKIEKVYIVRGIVGGHSSTHAPWCWCIWFKADTWQVLSDGPKPRDHFHTAYKNGKIYAAGGRNSSFATNQTFELNILEIDVNDIQLDTWETLPKKK